MIIPIRCFTCNRVLASKYAKYTELVSESKSENILSGNPDTKIEENDHMKAFKVIGIEDRYCCKRHILSHIDLIYKI